MARHYVDLMRGSVPHGRILLGGWSLGGLLALEMASVLAGDEDFTVIGLVIVDSICPEAFRAPSLLQVVPFKLEWNKNTKEETRVSVERCFSEATKMVIDYSLPKWGDDRERASDDEKVTISRPPPAILLRAAEAVPSKPGEVCRVDVSRADRHLGWDIYRKNLFNQVVDVSGHHYNIFAFEHIDDVSEKLKAACDTLEGSSSTW